MELTDIFSLGTAKFPPDQTPALLEEMKKAREQIAPATPSVAHPGAAEQVRKAYLEVIQEGEAVVVQLAAESRFDIVLVDRDVDGAGYGTIASLRAEQQAFYQWQVPLEDDEKQRLEDAQVVQRKLFPFSLEDAKKEDNIFNFAFLAEWNAVSLLLTQAEGKEMASRIERLGLQPKFRRLKKAHTILGQLLGITATSQDAVQETGFVRFISAMRRLLATVITNYGEDSKAHTEWRTLVLGPFQRHVEQYRERRKRHEQKTKTETQAPAPPQHEDDGL